ncbi:phospholipase B-like 1 [Strongylocentrotus purpuratus]|uniref:Phospholipase B-like n=1 Tax=Strongylocentrotus purpuratus TaxID=7668 RepID=A0A7M7ND26_STRPU|nr:phospholipase B-like 1 [Strongylocentrotus purpuratus]XP_030834703.1 phospholipase B-like 1 [Strongylocentrotus purpuratus]
MANKFRMFKILTAFLVLVLVNLSTGELLQGTVYKQEDGTFTVSSGIIDKQGVAYGSYNNTLFQTGWGELHLFAGYSTADNVALSDADRMYAAGILEGALTAKQISQTLQNINVTFFSAEGDPEIWRRVVDFFETQDAWMKGMIKERATEDPFWEGVALVLAQFEGLIKGYEMSQFSNASTSNGFLAMQVLNSCGDLLDLKSAVMPSLIPDWDKLTKKEFLKFIRTSGHCSALVKVLPAFEDVFMSHSSWFTYSATLRIYKHYHFKLDFEGNAAEVTSFSSYPGFLESLDDFYIMSSGLSMLQTTNNIFNKTLYKYVKPQSLLAWQRVRVANMMARSGKDWARIVARYNSGTYNNQYMVIDRTKIKPNVAILDDALWVVEQVPTLVASGDQTNILRAGYWPSYNVPFYEEIYNISGYLEYAYKGGADISYQLAPRAKIFRRDQGKVVDMESFKKIMRFNDYKNDPYSEGDPSKSICMRGDLMTSPMPNGCYDTKVTNLAMAAKQTSFVINGPTRGDGSLPPFKWVAPFTGWSHVGLPTVYDFNFVEMCPKEL